MKKKGVSHLFRGKANGRKMRSVFRCAKISTIFVLIWCRLLFQHFFCGRTDQTVDRWGDIRNTCFFHGLFQCFNPQIIFPFQKSKKDFFLALEIIVDRGPGKGGFPVLA